MTYYSCCHPTGVEIDLCCLKRPAGHRQPAGADPTAYLERPQFIDLREVATNQDAVEVGPTSNPDGDNAVGLTVIRPKSRYFSDLVLTNDNFLSSQIAHFHSG